MIRFKNLLYKYFCLFYCCLYIFLNEFYYFYIIEDIEEEITEEIIEGAENGEIMFQSFIEIEEEEGFEKFQMEIDSEGIVVMNFKFKRRGKAVNKLVWDLIRLIKFNVQFYRYYFVRLFNFYFKFLI